MLVGSKLLEINKGLSFIFPMNDNHLKNTNIAFFYD